MGGDGSLHGYLLSPIPSLGCILPVETIFFDLLLQGQVSSVGWGWGGPGWYLRLPNRFSATLSLASHKPSLHSSLIEGIPWTLLIILCLISLLIYNSDGEESYYVSLLHLPPGTTEANKEIWINNKISYELKTLDIRSNKSTPFPGNHLSSKLKEGTEQVYFAYNISFNSFNNHVRWDLLSWCYL